MDGKTKEALKAFKKEISFWVKRENVPGVYSDCMIDTMIEQKYLSYKIKSHSFDEFLGGLKFYNYIISWKFGNKKGWTKINTTWNDKEGIKKAIYRDLIKIFKIKDY